MPPLYYYAECLNQFYTFDLRLLDVGSLKRGNKRRLHANKPSMVLTHYLLCRIDSMGSGARAAAGRSMLAPKILYENEDGRPLLEELGLALPEEPRKRERRIKDYYGRNYSVPRDGQGEENAAVQREDRRDT